MRSFLLKTIYSMVIFTSLYCHSDNTIPAEALFKQPDIFSMSLSPKGDFILEVGRTTDQRIVNLIETETFKKYRISTELITKSDPITDYTWLNDATLYIEDSNDTYIVKIDVSVSPLSVAWHKVPVNGYILSKQIDNIGQIVFAKTDGDYGEFYRLYKMTIDDLLSGELGFLQKYRINLSKAHKFYLDDKTDVLLGHTFEDDSVQVWYLAPNDILWSKLFKHEIKDKFQPISLINQNSIAVLTNKNSDHTYLAEFNIAEQKFTKTLYEHPAHDLINATVADDGKIHSISYIQHGVPTTEYLSTDTKTLKTVLAERIKNHHVSIAGSNEANDKHLIITHGSDTPGELFLFNSNKNHLKSLGLLRKNLKNYKLAKAEVFEVVVHDALTIEGIVTKPTGDSNGVLLVNPHGGPIGVQDNASFNLEHQYYASRGYTILNVNFRGSTGFGKSFEDQGRGQFGQLIEEDIMSVYQYLIKNNHFDYTCAMGASYGGYSSMMLAIKHPDIFHCAIASFGVFDLPHMFNTTNFRTLPKEQEAWQRVMGDDLQQLKVTSPIKLAHKLQVPVFIMAGTDDSITSFEQSNRMKYVLEKLGKPVDFHAYENTGHGHNLWTGDLHQHEATHKFIQSTRSNFYRIIEAFKRKDIDEIETLIKKSTHIDAQDRKGYSLLHYAVELKDQQLALKVMEILLKNDIYIDIEDDYSQTPLYLAVLKNKPSIVSFLLSNDANENTRNNNGWTPLFLAASEGYVEVAKKLLTYDIDFSYRHKKGWNALMFTTNAFKNVDANKQAQVAKLLIDDGSDIEAKTTRGLSVLMNAAFNGKLEIVKLLVAAGANVHVTNSKARHTTALGYAKKEKHDDIVQYLTPIVKNAKNHTKQTFNLLIDRLLSNDIEGALAVIPVLAPIDFYDDKGETAMHYAMNLNDVNDSISVISTLLAHKADINFRNKRKRSPLYLAVEKNSPALVKFLLENGAQLNQKGPHLWTPLFQAISSGKVKIVKEMSKYWLDFEHTSKNGWHAFMYITNTYHKAQDKDQALIGKILIQQGADIELRIRNGVTPLMNAAENGKFEVVKILIEAGADIHAKNPKQENKTPLDYANEFGHKDIAEYLRKKLASS